MLRKLDHLLLALSLWALGAGAWAAAPAPVVAHVTLAVGQVQLVVPSGVQQPLLPGASLTENSRIITGDDAMAMLVFADQARLALRPNTEIIIRRYRVDPTGAETALDLDLLRGSVRQISGQAARRQPERFRLNTPIAAIGVRGTDFLAKAEQRSVETYVHEGAIVIQPHAGGEDLAVSAQNGSSYLRLQPEGRIERRNLTPEEIERIFGLHLAAAGGAASPSAAPLARAPLPEAQRPTLLDEALTPVPPRPQPTQLVWGRFSSPLSLPLQLPLAYAQASQGRHVTVGELGQYALWREGRNTGLDAGVRGQAQFALAAGEAYYQAVGQDALPLRIDAAQLQIDFDRSRFNTQLMLTGAGAPSQALGVGGRINSDGIFNGTAAGQRVAGATSLDGREAGYLFQIDASQGIYQGITLWTKK